VSSKEEEADGHQHRKHQRQRCSIARFGLRESEGTSDVGALRCIAIERNLEFLIGDAEDDGLVGNRHLI